MNNFHRFLIGGAVVLTIVATVFFTGGFDHVVYQRGSARISDGAHDHSWVYLNRNWVLIRTDGKTGRPESIYLGIDCEPPTRAGIGEAALTVEVLPGVRHAARFDEKSALHVFTPTHVFPVQTVRSVEEINKLVKPLFDPEESDAAFGKLSDLKSIQVLLHDPAAQFVTPPKPE